MFHRERNDCDRQRAGVQRGHGKTDAVDCDGAFPNEPFGGVRRDNDFEIPVVAASVEPANPPDSIDMALNDVAAETRVGTHRSFQIHLPSDSCVREGRSVESLTGKVCFKMAIRDRGGCDADTVGRDAGAWFRVREHGRRQDPQAPKVSGFADTGDLADFFNYSCEHSL